MNATEIKAAIEARMEELRPLLVEYEKLVAAVGALADIPKADMEVLDLEEPKVKLANSQRSVPKRTKRRYSKGEKEAAVKQAQKTSIKKSSRTYGIPVSTVRSWIKTG